MDVENPKGISGERGKAMNTRKTMVITVFGRYPQRADRALSRAAIFIAFQLIIMIFLIPAHLRAAYTIHQGTDVEIRGDYAYVAVTGTSHSATDVIYTTPPPPELPSGLRVIDISVPDSPEIVGGLDYSNSGILCLTVDGDLAYLAYSGSEGVKIIDISNPEKPKVIGTIKNVYAREIVVGDGYAYIADPESGLVIYDVSAPAAPVRAARLALNGAAGDMAVQGDFAYLAFANDDSLMRDCGIHVCDISNPQNPLLVNRFVVGTSITSDVSSSGQVKIWLKGDHAYWTRGASNVIVDVSNPANPVKKGMVWTLPGLPPHAHVPSVTDLAGSGDYLYMIASGQEGQEKLFVVDISDPLDPDTLGDVTTYKAKGIAVQGDHACIVGWDGFQIIDISDPDAPSVAGRIKSTQTGGTSGTVGYGVYGYPYGYGFGLPGYGYGYGLPGYGYPGGYTGYGFGLTSGYGFGYPGYGYGYPTSSSGTSSGYGYGLPGYGLGRTTGYGYPIGYPGDRLAGPGYGYGLSYPGYGYTGYGYGRPYGYGLAYPGGYPRTAFGGARWY